MSYDPEEDWSAASWLGAFANTLWNQYRDYWELNDSAEGSFSPAQRLSHRRLAEVAEALVPCLHSLAVDAKVTALIREFFVELGSKVSVDEEFAALVARVLQSRPVVRDRIRIQLAMQASDVLLADAEQRVPVLIDLVANRALSTRAAAFLDRATRLYLWGFAPEAVVMCGSVLEAAYESRFPAAEMFRLQIPRKGPEYQPYEYEHAALVSGVFSKQQKDLAAKVRRARNDTLHNAPNTSLGAETAIRDTASLLECLFPR